ncbi:MAG: VOC family protein [Phycisphaerales bacterium]|nr:VOC family protein [Phycisphaerales bacterium]
MTTHAPAQPIAQPAHGFADKLQMQSRLFAELSRMFGREAPLYDKSLLVNRVCNRAVCDLLAQRHQGFSITDDEIDAVSGERHGAVRIGRPDEFRWVGRFFAAFAMEPHDYYDMTIVGARSQPVVATAFRSVLDPDHRVFCSLLQTDYFDPATRARIEGLLARRQVFSDNAKRLIEKGERQGGLDHADADALIREGADRIFKWTGRAADHTLYTDLCASGFKIAADIACFERHHLNHLTPNTFCMDLYTAAMKFCMGEMDEPTFRLRAERSLARVLRAGDADFLRLNFKRLARERIDAYQPAEPPAGAAALQVDALVARLRQDDLALHRMKHAGFKDFTEGPSEDTPVLLRQDAYKALTEPVTFVNDDGTTVEAEHTARFGEIEQRFYATTPKGRELFDRCLAEADAAREKDPGLPRRDFDAYESLYAAPFRAFPKSLPELLRQGLVYGRYSPTAQGIAARGTITTTDIHELVCAGHARQEGLRYEDFLPVSAAGIFASNLNQYGTRSTAAAKPVYTRKALEDILGRPTIDSEAVYRAVEAESLLHVYERLGLMDRLPPERRAALKNDAEALAGVPGVQGR